MKQEIEIEFKNIITQEEFKQLLYTFSIKDEDFITQENHYFDTETFSLKNNGCALRIRKKNNAYEMTLKQPAKDGLLETNIFLEEDIAHSMMERNIIPNNAITQILQDEFTIDASSIQYFGSLVTNRAETKYKSGLLVLDHSIYLNKEDYEIEYEVEQFKQGQKDFEELLKKLNIPLRKTDNKIKRFYNEKYKS